MVRRLEPLKPFNRPLMNIAIGFSCPSQAIDHGKSPLCPNVPCLTQDPSSRLWKVPCQALTHLYRTVHENFPLCRILTRSHQRDIQQHAMPRRRPVIGQFTPRISIGIPATHLSLNTESSTTADERKPTLSHAFPRSPS